MSKSSLELFAIALYDNGLLQGNGNQIDDLLLHFKAMHKEEMIQSCDKMQIIDDVDFDGNVTFIFNPQKYYEQTYGGNK